ncbi:hypothetical protein EG240_02565 [Paenimyroides tangerinum]|uniref:Uncharacterized protein n=1 Tax=Paenimyroides tangerinum TaxID=2488728 RepID=A0A3P3WF62_9FLAO|nr:hypothetical protein [Paenimyroides tangerinum]RRJ92686.1 hypothetical protein EG240_02565 [Paenimyroides tangerinum]
MKFVIFVTLIFFPLQDMKSQNIIDLFYVIPDKFVDDLTVIERKELLKNESIIKDDMIYYINFDKQNGYLRFEQNYMEGQSGYAIFEITFWNLKNKKLIAVSSVFGSNGGFHQNDFKFFEYKNGILSLVKTGYLKNYSNNFEDFINRLVSEFTKVNVNQTIKEDLKYIGFTIDLPKEGKNINVSFTESDLYNEYSKYLNKESKIYIFNKESELFE